MNLQTLASQVVALGAPQLGSALAGPLGEAAGKMLADALGAEPASPATIEARLATADPNVLAEADRQWAEAVRAAAAAQQQAISETQQTIRAELASEDPLQRWWRPVYAIELTLECAALWVVVVEALWSGSTATVSALIANPTLLVAYWGFRFGVLGVYVSGRTREKVSAATGETVPSLLEQMLGAARKKR